MSGHHRIAKTLVLVTLAHKQAAEDAGAEHVEVIEPALGSEQVLRGDAVRSELAVFEKYLIALPEGMQALRDDIAVRLGDDRCRYVDWPKGAVDIASLRNAMLTARPMWTDEIATIDDIPDPGEVKTYKTGFYALDQHGLRIVPPALMSVVGPYGSGKSVFLRQLACNLWRLHGWKCLITAFEERVKPVMQMDLRRHLIGKPVEHWTDEDIASADAQIRQCAVFFRRERNAVLDMERLLDRLEFAVRAYGVRVVIIDPVNEIEHQVPRGESKTDYMGRFIMALKRLADDYGLLMICALHPPKDGVEKRLSKNSLLTLNDAADTAHWGNKSDIGLCMWRDLEGPTLLHIDKLKQHDLMGRPTLAQMTLNRALNRFSVDRVGYDILRTIE